MNKKNIKDLEKQIKLIKSDEEIQRKKFLFDKGLIAKLFQKNMKISEIFILKPA